MIAMSFSWIEALIVAAIAIIIVAVGWAGYSNNQRQTIELNKDDWECTKSDQRSQLQPMPVGKVMVMSPMTRTVCVEYRLRRV